MHHPTYVLSESVILRDEPQYFDSYIVFDYHRNIFHYVDLPTLRVLERLQQHDLCATCISSLLREHAATASFEDLLAFSWLTISPNTGCDHAPAPLALQKPQNWIQALPPEQRRVAILTAPTTATLVLTQRCDLACVHCNVSAASLKAPELVSKEIWLRLFDDLERLSVFKVILSGGEPFVYRGFDEVLWHFGKKRFLKSILTNGTHVKQHHIRIMKENRIYPTLSIDGGDAATHDAFRRRTGAFSALLRTLQLLRDNDLPFNLVSVVHQGSVKQVRTIAEIAYQHFAGGLYFVPLKELGRGRSARKWTVGMQTYLHVRAEIDRMRSDFSGMSISFDEELDESKFGPSPDKTQYQDTPFGYTTCMAGKNGLVVDNDGKVYGCMLGMHTKVHPVGQILHSSIEEIWRYADWGIYRQPLGSGCRADMLYKLETQRTHPLTVLS